MLYYLVLIRLIRTVVNKMVGVKQMAEENSQMVGKCSRKGIGEFPFIAIIISVFLIAGNVSAAEQTVMKYGNEFSSTSGSYATRTHCAHDTCGWISGNQVIVGVYSSNPSTWSGSVTWDFDLSSIPMDEIESAEVVIRWPSYYGKGLHSTTQTGEGIVRVNGNEIVRLVTDYGRCNNDYFAHSCFTRSLTYDIPTNLISSTTSVKLETTSRTAWDVGTVTLIIHRQDAPGDFKVELSGDYGASVGEYSTISIDGDFILNACWGSCTHCSWDEGLNMNIDTGTYCGDSLLEVEFSDSSGVNLGCNADHRACIFNEGWHCCENQCDTPGCTNTVTFNCGDWSCVTTSTTSTSTTALPTTTVPTTIPTTTIPTTTTTIPCLSSPSQNLNSGDNVIDFQTPHPYPDDMNCYSNVYVCPPDHYGKAYVKYDIYSIFDKFYIYDVDDNTSSYWYGDSGGFVWIEHPDTRRMQFRFTSSPVFTDWGIDVDKINCYSLTTTTIPTTSIPTTSIPTTTIEPYVEITGGKIYLDDELFLVKGVDYAPWILTTGPDPHVHLPFPDEYDDVTELVRHNSQIYVTDYSNDGIIQAWEVIQFDLETMQGVGANTIRTYASGGWHDKNLNGILDRSPIPEVDEISQGDLPFWVYDRMVDFCEQNDMKIIIGYWIQEEDFVDEDPGTPGYQLECDWNDLEVAKDTMRRVVERYGDSDAVIIWGIGNEVNWEGNHGWFDWTVDINDYLNALFAYVKSIDSNNKPIMYAKYIGENTNFNTLNAEIIAPNAYISSAQELIDQGEFDIPAPEGKAYLVGEFGHVIGHAEDHWDLSEQYAGGNFLEYNDVWWKTDQTELGLVEEYRAKRHSRYDVVYELYQGVPVTTTTSTTTPTTTIDWSISFTWTVIGTATEVWTTVDYKYSGYLCYNCFGTDSWECPSHPPYVALEMINPYGGNNDGPCGCPDAILDSPRLLNPHDHTSTYYCVYGKDIEHTNTLTRSDSASDSVMHSDEEKIIKTINLDFTTDPKYQGGDIIDVEYSPYDDDEKVLSWISGNDLIVCIDSNLNGICDYTELDGDSDLDGVPDEFDNCLGTPRGCVVDVSGCEIDSDSDGVCDGIDCDNSNSERFPGNIDICSDGIDQDCSGSDAPCPAADQDWDGVIDGSDSCPDTQFGCLVDSNGCAIDSDSDGLCDRATPFYFQITANGSYPPVAFGWTVQGTATETYQQSEYKYSSSICYWCFGSDNWVCPDKSNEGWIVKEKIRLPHPGSHSDHPCCCPSGLYDSYPGVVSSCDDTTAFYCKYEKLVDATQPLHSDDSGTATVNPDQTLSGETTYVLDFAHDPAYNGGTVSDPFATLSVDNPSVNASKTESFSGTVLSGDILATSPDTGPWSDSQIGGGVVEPDDINKQIFISNLVAPNGDTIYFLDYLTINRKTIVDNTPNDEEPGDNSIGYEKVIVWITGNEVRASVTFNPPVAFIDTITRLIASEGETISFFGHGEDEDGTIIAYNWESHLDGFLSSLDFFEKTLSLGTHVIRFTVEDNDNHWSPEANEFVKVNSKPVAYIASIPDVAIVGEPAVFAGKGVDSDGYALEHEWTSDIDGKIGSQSFITVTDLSIGIHTISYSVKDNNGEWSIPVSKTVTVRRVPVVFVHGFQGPLKKQITIEYNTDELDPLEGNYFSPNAEVYFDSRDLKESAGILDGIIENVKSQTGSKRVDIVAHSMGTLISRWVVQFGPRNDVRKMILIGGPSHGSDWAYLSDIKLNISGFTIPIGKFIGDPALSQMEPHSLFLNTLNNNDKCATHGEGNDQLNRLTRHHVISGDGYPTPAHKHLDFEVCFKVFGERVCLIKFHKIIPWMTMRGDGVVAVRSAYLSDVPSDERHLFHLNQDPNHPKILEIITTVLTEGETPNALRIASLAASEGEEELDYSTAYHWIGPFNGTLTPQETKTHEFEIDSTMTRAVITSKGDALIKLFDPYGLEIDGSQPGVEVVEEEGFVIYEIEDPTSGNWTVSLSSPLGGAIDYQVNAFMETGLFVSAGSDKDMHKPGDSIVIMAFVQNGAEFLPGATVMADIKLPNGTIKTIPLPDDGDDYDDESDDGIYTNALNDASLEGDYEVTVNARINLQGNELERSVILNVPVEFLPDLVMSPGGITFSNPNPTHGESITLTADITNIGEEDAENVEILFFDRDPRKDGKFIGKTVIDKVPKQIQTGSIKTSSIISTSESKKTASIAWRAEYGNHDINAIISPYGSYLDANYSNNKIEQKILTSDLVSPNANAGPDQKVFVNNFVSFDASRSSDNVLISTYSWDIDTLTDSDEDGVPDNDVDFVGLNPILESGYPSIGAYTAQLSVDDQAGNGPVRDTVTITVTDEPDVESPTENAGMDIGVVGGELFKFDGTDSSDNYAVTIYLWDVDVSKDSDRDGIADNDVDLLGAMPEFRYPAPGSYTAKLTVDDAAGNGPVSDYLNINVAEDCVDDDEDGYYVITPYCAVGADCDDSDPAVNPGANEICDDNIDNDCDGETDIDDEDCMEITIIDIDPTTTTPTSSTTTILDDGRDTTTTIPTTTTLDDGRGNVTTSTLTTTTIITTTTIFVDDSDPTDVTTTTSIPSATTTLDEGRGNDTTTIPVTTTTLPTTTIPTNDSDPTTTTPIQVTTSTIYDSDPTTTIIGTTTILDDGRENETTSTIGTTTTLEDGRENETASTIPTTTTLTTTTTIFKNDTDSDNITTTSFIPTTTTIMDDGKDSDTTITTTTIITSSLPTTTTTTTSMTSTSLSSTASLTTTLFFFFPAPSTTTTTIPYATSLTTSTSTSTTTTSTTTLPIYNCITGDKDCDSTVSDFELLDYIELWVQGGVEDFALLNAIDAWAS